MHFLHMFFDIFSAINLQLMQGFVDLIGGKRCKFCYGVEFQDFSLVMWFLKISLASSHFNSQIIHSHNNGLHPTVSQPGPSQSPDH